MLIRIGDVRMEPAKSTTTGGKVASDVSATSVLPKKIHTHPQIQRIEDEWNQQKVV